MASSIITYNKQTIWIGDWWISIFAFFFLRCIEEGNYDKDLDPVKDQVIERLVFDTNGFVAGALDLGSDIIIDNNLVKPYVDSLERVREKIKSEGSFISKDKCKQINRLSFDPYSENEITEESTEELIELLNKIINLFKVD